MPRSSTPQREKISSSIRSTSIAPLLSPILSRHSSASPIIDLTKSPEPFTRSVAVATTPKRIRHSSSRSSASPGVTQFIVRAIIHASRSPRPSSRSPRGGVNSNTFDIRKDWSDDQTASGSGSSVIPAGAQHRIRPILYASDSSNLSSTSSEKSGLLFGRLFGTPLDSPPRNLIESSYSSKSTSPIQLVHSDRSDEIISKSNERSNEDSGNVSSVRIYPDTSSPSIFIDLTTSDDDDDDADVLDDNEEKERLKLAELEAKSKKSEHRKVRFVKPDYLHVDGVEWHSYNHDYISFTFSSSKIKPILHYRFSLKFNGKRWIIKTFQVPNYEQILELYNASNMYDKHVNSFLKSVLTIIRTNIDEQVKFKDQKMRSYRLGRKIEINVSDEIMLSEFERSFLKRKRKEIEGRMKPSKRRKYIK